MGAGGIPGGGEVGWDSPQPREGKASQTPSPGSGTEVGFQGGGRLTQERSLQPLPTCPLSISELGSGAWVPGLGLRLR